MMIYSECKIIAKRGGLNAKDYKFECKSGTTQKNICVKGQTINENQAVALCKKGDFDDMSDCKNWK